MNKEKLINIILKDINELKDISEEIRKDSPSQKLETDIALSKATIILQEFQLLKEKYLDGSRHATVDSPKMPIFSEIKTEEKVQEEPIVSSEPRALENEEPELVKKVEETLIVIDEEATDEDENHEYDKLQPEATDYQLVEMIEEEEGEQLEDDDEQFSDEDLIKEEEEEEEEFDEDELEDEDDFEKEDEEIAPPPFEKQTVGEKFHAEKSLNDRLENNNTLDQKISHSPIISLQSAIGINDRFLFIREIFDNDSALYAAAIKRIDSCENIKEAVEYLSSNFKIKKTETSLKFVELIKRRFAK